MIHPDVIRSMFDYHYAVNRKIWDTSVMALTDEQFRQQVDYSVGSVRNQVVHLINIDERWFSGLRGVEVPGFTNPVYYHTREKVRAYGDQVEAGVRAYLNALTEEQVHADFENLKVWQVLVHVANHGTDHRAQLLRLLHDLGAPTLPQDFVFWLWGKI
jgi:uncharacterized damage-inducible protein DinB